jgi:hypothetical protein
MPLGQRAEVDLVAFDAAGERESGVERHGGPRIYKTRCPPAAYIQHVGRNTA